MTKVRAIRAFIPDQDMTLELNGERWMVFEKVIYLIPHAMSKGVAIELETQGEGRII